MQDAVRDVGNPWPEGRPSRVVGAYYIHVHTEHPQHFSADPASTSMQGVTRLAFGGKWLLFVDRANIDEVWDKIVPAVKEGRLGPEAKVSTAESNPLTKRPSKHVVCIYTLDAEDREDVFRVREELRRLGFIAPINYKPDAATLQGRYEGSGRVATYRE